MHTKQLIDIRTKNSPYFMITQHQHEWKQTQFQMRICNAKYKIDNDVLPFKARILEFGFISAESAVMGLLKGCIGILISIITTLFCGAVSRTHMYLSDSIVTWVNVMNCGLIPMLGSCNYIRSHKLITQLLWNKLSNNYKRNVKFYRSE